MASTKFRPAIRLPPLPTIRDIIRLYNLRALKDLSQNFLLNEQLTDKIVRAAGNITDGYVCEVGPGPGGITRSILRQKPLKLIVVEKDPRFVPTLNMLRQAVGGKVDFDIIVNDILQTDLHNMFPIEAKVLWESKPPNIHLIGNLPFSVSTILIIRWLEAISKQSSAWKFGRTKMTLTFQKEVAERIVAPILTPRRCRLSVMCQNWCVVDLKFKISGRSFLPKPDVDVGVVTFTPLRNPIIPLDFKLIEKLLRNMFNMRQKYSFRGIQTLFPDKMKRELAIKMCELAEFHPETRPFQITNEEFKRLCFAYDAIIKEYPDVANYDFRACKKDLIQEC